ncbi:MAG TPA: hypothetical protein VI911_01050 [Patescibacteria group bacterium]|nr:hypothetical protein [Patescibacteria group bacterium]
MIMQIAAKAAGTLAYVLVEMVNKDKARNREVKTAKDIEKGLFEGIMVHLYPNNSTRVYVVLSTAPNKTVLLDTEFYNVLSIEAYEGTTREYLFWRDTEEDQKAAFSELSDLLNVLINSGKTIPGFDVVDLTCYTDLPKHFMAETTNNTTKVHSSTNVSNVSSTPAYSNTVYNKGTVVSVSGTKTPTFFTRKSKPPHWKTLEQIKSKLKDLAGGKKLDIPIPSTDATAEVFCSGAVSVGSYRDIYNEWD